MSRTFFKMTGSGNDFVFVDGRWSGLDDWPPQRIRRVCARQTGVGADGLVHLAPGSGGVLAMAYFNADGSRAELCGNAALCAVRLAGVLGLAGSGPVVLETDSGRLEGRGVGPGWAAELRFGTVVLPQPTELALMPGERLAYHGTVGVPHTILLVDDIRSVDVIGRGRQLRSDSRLAPAGTNVNFVAPAQGSEAEWRLRTYERGVETETLACGSGTVAAALALAAAGLGQLPARIESSSGMVLSVSGELAGREAREVWLCGEGRLVFTGLLAED
jgi:diaminopimelate epimerase